MGFKAGFITIGQSPREDIFSDIGFLLGPGIEILEKGALDGLSRAEIAELCPKKRDFSLLTRLRDKTSVIVSRKRIIPLLQKKIGELEREEVQLIAFLCTENFHELKSRCLLIFPSRILLSTVQSVIKKGKLAVFIPLEEQKDGARKKWEKTGLKTFVEVLNPYQGLSETGGTMAPLKEENIDLVVFDCMGYTLEIKEKIRQELGRPVLLPRSLLAGMVRELAASY